MQTPFACSRLLRTMLRVGDLERSLTFYISMLGTRLLRRQDYPDGCFTLAFLGYGHESEATVIELTHNWDFINYEGGAAYGHLALSVENIGAACAALRAAGISTVRPPCPMNTMQQNSLPSSKIQTVTESS